MPLSSRTFQKINRSTALASALRARAEIVAATAQRITNSDGGEATISVESGIRPGGRAYSNVVSSSRAEEYGDETTPRIRAIGRAARVT